MKATRRPYTFDIDDGGSVFVNGDRLGQVDRVIGGLRGRERALAKLWLATDTLMRELGAKGVGLYAFREVPSPVPEPRKRWGTVWTPKGEERGFVYLEHIARDSKTAGIMRDWLLEAGLDAEVSMDSIVRTAIEAPEEAVAAVDLLRR